VSALVLNAELAADIVRAAAHRYGAERRTRLGPYVDRTFSLLGALKVHRAAFGWDLLRAPANLALAGPQLASRITASLAKRIGLKGAASWLDAHPAQFRTDVIDEIEYRLFADLLELPYQRNGRSVLRDAFAEECLRDPRLQSLLEEALRPFAGRLDDPGLRAWLDQALITYGSARVSAADFVNGLLSAGAGGLAFHKLTPGALSLGPAAAQALVQHAAIAAFPLGATMGGAWYSVFPATVPLAVTVATTGGVAAGLAALSAFAGVLADPVQRWLGLHRRRLERLIDGLERALAGEDPKDFTVRDHYVARLLDLADGLAMLAARAH
jgi:hypothetical protein